MKYVTRERFRITVATTTGVLTALLVGLFMNEAEVATASLENSAPIKEEVYLATVVIPLQVSGVIKSADNTTIYAETAGVVTGLPAKEGVFVSKGSLLSSQNTPVADAKLQLATAERNLTQVQQQLSIASSELQVEQSVLKAYSAVEIASLREVGNDNRLTETATQMLSQLEQNILTIVETINYINNNRPAFSAAGLDTYDSVVASLYGKIPSYFQGGVTRPVENPSDLFILLEGINTTDALSVLEVQKLVGYTSGQLESLQYLFATAEDDIFDRASALATVENQLEFNAKRTEVLAAKRSLEIADANLQKIVDTVLVDSVTQQSQVEVTVLDEELSELQSAYTEQIANQTDLLAIAGIEVVQAERSLAQVTAPFAGSVTKVLVEVGQYVTPGTPLLNLVGSGARELKVSVPTQFLTAVKVGQSFLVGDEVFGYVERFSLVSEGGSGAVIIALTNTELRVGSSLTGHLLLADTTDVYRLSRAYLHFDTDGSYLVYQDGVKSRVEILYDNGQSYFVRGSEFKDLPLVSANSISF